MAGLSGLCHFNDTNQRQPGIAFRTPQPPRCKTITKPPISPFHVKYPSSISFPRPFSEFHVQFQHPAHADDAAVLAAKKPAPEPDHVLSDGRFLRTFLLRCQKGGPAA